MPDTDSGSSTINVQNTSSQIGEIPAVDKVSKTLADINNLIVLLAAVLQMFHSMRSKSAVSLSADNWLTVADCVDKLADILGPGE